MNHEELKQQYTQDELLHPEGKPWEWWEITLTKDKWESLRQHPVWLSGFYYRRKSTAPNWEEELSPKEVAECDDLQEVTKCDHKELQQQYTQDELLHPEGKPWEWWEVAGMKDDWVPMSSEFMYFGEDLDYRRKPTAPNWDEELSPKEVAECDDWPEGYYFDGTCIRLEDNDAPRDWYVWERGRFNEDNEKDIEELEGSKQILLNHLKKRREAALATYGNAEDNPLSQRQQQATKDLQGVTKRDHKVFPEDDAERAKYPIGTLITEYFPNALAALAKHSWESNEKHNPGEPVHWAKDKSIGNIDRVFRHLIDGEKIHAAWRILELIERDITE